LRAKLVYFEFWVDPAGPELLRRSPGVELVELRYADDVGRNWYAVAQAHGYQIASRVELQAPWFADAALIARAPHLLAVSSTGSGYDVVDVDACTSAGIVVCNQAGANRRAVAEHAIGFMISLSKKIAFADRAQRVRALERFEIAGNDIGEKTVGIVGLGHIGSYVARLCNAFGMNVLAYDPYLEASTIGARGATKVGFDELLDRADFVSVHCPRTPETLGMFGAPEFARMKPTAFFINTARGGIHDEAALADALRSRAIAGAGLDVFVEEPPPAAHPLLAFDNVIVTPHTAGLTVEALHNLAHGAAKQWVDIFAGKVPPRLVNPKAWPRYRERFAAEFSFAPAPLN
jgi:D-3-phosphoglycerate dehydrogenase